MEKEKIRIELDVAITQEDIDDIVATALEGGINYWCREAEVVGEYLGEYASEQISRGGVLKLHDIENGKTYKLNKEKLVNGIKMYLEDTEKPYDILDVGQSSVGCSKGEYTLDCCMVDGCVADMIIQYALFKEIMFG